MFLHPWAIAIGVAAASLPVIIHLLTKPKPVRMRLSTLRFVQAAVEDRRATHRLRDWLVLALRTLAVLFLATAIARPLLGSANQEQATDAADTVRIVVLDVSQSMAARESGVERMERARSVAAAQFEWRSKLKANLIVAAARPRSVFAGASSNFAVVREELNKVSVLSEELDAQAALDQAAEMLSTGGTDVRRELIVVSDFQRSNWASVNFAVLPEDTEIELVSVASAGELPNAGILSVRAAGRPETGREVTIECEVGNYSPTLRKLQVDIDIGDASLQLAGECAANSRVTLTGRTILPASGWQFGTARLAKHDDAFPADDVRPWVLRSGDPPKFLLLTREPADRVPSSSFYLQQAIETSRSTRLQQALTRVRPDDLDQRIAASADVVIVDHPGPLSVENCKLLASLLRRNRAVFYVAAETVDATNIARLVDASAGSVRLPVEFQPPRSGRARKDLVLVEIQSKRAPFAAFGDDLESMTSELKFAGGLMSRSVENRLTDDILASYADRTACLVTAACDAGALVVLNADLGRSDIVTAPIFPSLLDELTRSYLLSSRDRADGNLCGEPFVVSLPADVSSLEGLQVQYRRVGDSDWRNADSDALRQESSGLVWSSERASGPAVARVLDGERTLAATATVGAPVESDLRSLDAELFEDRLSGGRNVSFQSVSGTGSSERDTAWNWMLVAGVLCGFGELIVLKLFGI